MILIDNKKDEFEIVDNGRFAIGDLVTFVYKDRKLRTIDGYAFGHWYSISQIDDRFMYLTGFGSTPLLRGPDSVYAYARKVENKNYELDQVLDSEEDLL